MAINNSGHFNHQKKRSKKKTIILEILVFFISLGIVVGSVLLIWVSSFTLPDFSTIASRQLESTTKIYDRTGALLLRYTLNQEYY